MNKTVVEKYVENPEQMRYFQQERAILDVTDKLESLLEEMGVSRSRFAELLGKSKGWITQLLDGEENKTIRTIADAFAVLGHEFCCFYRPIKVSNRVGSTVTTKATLKSRTGASPHPSIRQIKEEGSTNTIGIYEVIQESA